MTALSCDLLLARCYVDLRGPFRRDAVPLASVRSAVLDRRDAFPARPAKLFCNLNSPCVIMSACTAVAAATYRVKTASGTEASRCQRVDSPSTTRRRAQIRKFVSNSGVRSELVAEKANEMAQSNVSNANT